MRKEIFDLDGLGRCDHEVYDVAPRMRGGRPDFWAAVTDIPCPIPGCGQVVVWYEAGYVPGHRVCMLGHRFLARGTGLTPYLIRLDD